MKTASLFTSLLADIGGRLTDAGNVRFTGEGGLPSAFAVTDFAAASIGAAMLALRDFAGRPGEISVDRRLASLWFGTSFRAVDWSPPPLWDAYAGDYHAVDGWIRLHTNAPHHRAAALKVLGDAPDRAALAKLVGTWRIDELEAAVVAAGGCAAAMRSTAAWQTHPVGAGVAIEPLIAVTGGSPAARPLPEPRKERPLAGIRVLDLTRILAGPVATRFLAGFGADVLRIDPVEWDEGATIPEIMLGKRAARLNLKSHDGRQLFLSLLADADVLVHGYRSDALEALGLGDAVRDATAPGIVDVALDAYGWSTEWKARRGFDSLLQMSCGIADTGMRVFGTTGPKPLPVQALDHATGYLAACAALMGLAHRRQNGAGASYRLSLARTAKALVDWGEHPEEPALALLADSDFGATPEAMSWGSALRLLPPASFEGAPMRWDRPARALGSDQPAWLG